MTRTVKVFISSPGDVQAERERCEAVINKVADAIGGHVAIRAVRWEDGVYSAAGGFQDQIDPPSSADLMVCILWKRLGSPLPPAYDRDGVPRTGTEYEFEDAMAAARKTGKPFILAYRKTAKVRYNFDDVDRQKAEHEAVDAFCLKWFRDEHGHFVGAHAGFETPQYVFRDVRDRPAPLAGQGYRQQRRMADRGQGLAVLRPGGLRPRPRRRCSSAAAPPWPRRWTGCGWPPNNASARSCW